MHKMAVSCLLLGLMGSATNEIGPDTTYTNGHVSMTSPYLVSKIKELVRAQWNLIISLTTELVLGGMLLIRTCTSHVHGSLL